jgi:threonine dehydrogenase-like Zn-dependent dehydrogenase
MTIVRPGGRYLVIGQAHDKTVAFNPTDLVLKQVTVIGSRSASIEHYWRRLEFLSDNAGRFSWQDLISAHYRLEEVHQAFDRMGSWQEIKPAVHLT